MDERENERIFPKKFYPDEHLHMDENGNLCQLDYTSIPYPTEAKSKVKFKVKAPYYEIDKEKIDALALSFKKLYPDIYERLSIRDVRGEKNNILRAIPEL